MQRLQQPPPPPPPPPQQQQQPQIRQISSNVTDTSSILFSPGSAADVKPPLHIPPSQVRRFFHFVLFFSVCEVFHIFILFHSKSKENETSPSITPPSRPPPQRAFPPTVVRMPNNQSYHRVSSADPFSPTAAQRPQFIVTSTAQNPQTSVRPSENESYTVVQSTSLDMTRQLRNLLQRHQSDPGSAEPSATTRIWVQGKFRGFFS